jgi:hypothetical protein
MQSGGLSEFYGRKSHLLIVYLLGFGIVPTVWYFGIVPTVCYFGIVPTVWYVCAFHFIRRTQMQANYRKHIFI